MTALQIEPGLLDIKSLGEDPNLSDYYNADFGLSVSGESGGAGSGWIFGGQAFTISGGTPYACGVGWKGTREATTTNVTSSISQTQIRRIDYATDTNGSSLLSATTSANVISSMTTTDGTYAWLMHATPWERMEFANDTSGCSEYGAFSLAATLCSVVQNSTYCWFGDTEEFYRFSFADDTTQTQIQSGLERPSRTADFGTEDYGWFAGGYYNSTAYSTVYRLDYSDDTTSPALRCYLSESKYGSRAVQIEDTAWICGGYLPSSSDLSSAISKIEFSSDTEIASVATMPLTLWYHSTTSNEDFGWIYGGASELGYQNYAWSNATAYLSSIIRMDFSTEAFQTRCYMDNLIFNTSSEGTS